MAKRGRKPKRKIDIGSIKGTITSALALGLIVFGVISLLAILAGLFGNEGTLNGILHYHLSNYFGLMAFLVSIIAIYGGLLIIGTIKLKSINYRILFGLLLLFIAISGIAGSSAGSTGIFLRTEASALVSVPGAIFVFIVIGLFSIVLITNKSLGSFVGYVGSIMSSMKNKLFGIDLPKDDFNFDETESLPPAESDEHLQLEPSVIESDESTKEYNINGYTYSNDKTGSQYIDVDTADDEFDDTNHKKTFEIIPPPSGPVEDEMELLNGSGIPPASISNSVDFDSGIIEDENQQNLASEFKDANEAKKVKPISESKLPFSNKLWEYPGLNLLSSVPNEPGDAGNVNERAKIIEDTLKAFGVKADIADVNIGPAFTRYDLNLSIGTKANKIQNLSTDLALRIKSPSGSVRVVAPIPGTNLVGIEVPNFKPSTVSLRSVMESSAMKSTKSKLTIALGHDVGGKPVVQDITKWPHCLVAGATGSGKSVMLNAIISTLLFRCSPQECKFIMIDPKMVELSGYNDIPHLLTPVVTDVEQKAVSALAWAVSEMERRYKIFSNARVRNLEAYNALSGFQAEPYIVIVIDELADMMMVAPSDVEKYITRLAQKSRATGIHLIVATQRPSVNVLTGTIKANIPTRIAFKVTSNVDSRVIIDQSGAETLIGRGDMLYVPPNDSKAVRIQGVWVSDDEINKLVDHLKNTGIEPDYREEITQQNLGSNRISGSGTSGDGVDEKVVEALEIIINEGKASASYLQRKLGIGYSRAARLIDIFEESGIIGQARGSKPRDVLTYSVDEALEKIKGSHGVNNDY